MNPTSCDVVWSLPLILLETFAEWKKGFDLEFGAVEKVVVVTGHSHFCAALMSAQGRMMFESGQVGEEDEAPAEQQACVLGGVC